MSNIPYVLWLAAVDGSWSNHKATSRRPLQPPSDGLFVVRESTSFPGDYTLCVSHDNKVELYHIMYKDTKLTIDEERVFWNLNQLIEVRTILLFFIL